MHETRRLLEAAMALSQLLRAAGVPHAFYGTVWTAVMSNAPQAHDIFCIVERGPTGTHPFRRVRQACAGSTALTTKPSPWANRLHATYHRLIPPIVIEILPAGEAGPRRLDGSTVIMIGGVPFLTVSEFIRAKMKAWALRGSEDDAQDIIYAFTHYWNSVDINRVPEQEMMEFVRRYDAVAPAWNELKKKYAPIKSIRPDGE